MSKEKNKIIVTIVLVILIVLSVLYLIDINRMNNNKPVIFSTWGKNYKVNTKVSVVTSLEDKIEDNSVWCGTFNLIWNDLKNDLAKQDIVFESQTEIVNNLNKGTFNTSYLSEKDYYKIYGIPSRELKKQIEKEIKQKFSETSDILDDFSWESANQKDYFLYAMLKKEFEFPKEFTELGNGEFGNYKNVKYFGIDSSTDEAVRSQVKVLYYNSEEDFGIKLVTKTNDEVIIIKGTNEDTFAKIYDKIKQKENTFNEEKYFTKQDVLKIPNINFNAKEEITEVENKTFKFSNGEEYIIEKALQTIKFELDKKGGKIKSEAGMMVKNEGMSIETKPRKFVVDGTFTILLKEKDKDLPYFAAKISDISKVQDNVVEK